ncbi:MAG: hypothetical protein IID46_02375 [Planctomycetes bacterium]|nr:hypothetical protein [Planctomycetota bacterium]
MIPFPNAIAHTLNAATADYEDFRKAGRRLAEHVVNERGKPSEPTISESAFTELEILFQENPDEKSVFKWLCNNVSDCEQISESSPGRRRAAIEGFIEQMEIINWI